MTQNDKTLRYYIVDAFTDKAFGGNPAGVVLLEGDAFPDEAFMLQIAAELRYSETAFVLRHSKKEYILRYFTPTAEVDLCGHATGTANAALTHYLQHNGCIETTGAFTFLQGETMGRPSVIATSITADGTIYVGGTAAIVAKGELFCL